MARLRHHLAKEDGTAMIELALVLPILAFLALAIVDFGKAINYWNDTNQIAASAARYAAVNTDPGKNTDGSPKNACGLNGSSPCTSFADWVRRQAETGELGYGDPGVADGDASTSGPLQVCVAFPNGAKTVGNPIKITVRTGYSLIPLLNARPAFDHGVQKKRKVIGLINIAGEATMRLEQTSTLTAGCS